MSFSMSRARAARGYSSRLGKLLPPTGRLLPSIGRLAPRLRWRVNSLAEFSMTEESRSIHSRALPNYERAEIPRSKLEGYALDPANDEGQHKARVFKSALGFDQSNWELLKQRILDELPFHEATPGQASQWGEPYVVALPIEGPNGNTAKVHTVWMFKRGTDFPSLITVYVLPERN